MSIYKEISLDIETYSDVDLGKCGVYKYVEGDFHILLFAYAFDDEEVKVVDMAQGEELPQEVLDAIDDPGIIKWAWNAQFERTCIGKYLGRVLSPDSWRCSMVHAASLSLPLKLKTAAQALKTGEQKDDAGERLIRYFSIPCKPTKSNGGRTRNLPEHDPKGWETFKSYCKQDVRTERDIRKRLEKFPLMEREWDFYHMDQRINDRGVLIDRQLVEQAITCDLMFSEAMTKKAYELTGLENPNSVSQLKSWLEQRGITIDSLGKKDVAALITDLDKHSVDGEALDMLKLRLQMAKSSVKKYQAADRCTCDDGRARGLFQFSGANRTQRWSGRNIQLQNLPQNHISTLNEARELVKMGCFDMVESIYGNTPDILSQLIRTMLVAKPGHKFIVADFSAIEARVLAWLAGEQWRMEAFKSGEDIYCASASQMFGVPVVKHGINGELRQKGKVAELACGYGGSTGALIAMGALEMGLKESELPDLIQDWRTANPHIVQFWWDIEKAAVETVKDYRSRRVGRIGIQYSSNTLWLQLPSGRKLAYIKPKLQPNRFGRMSVTFEGQGGTGGKWIRQETYSGKLVENCIAKGTEVLTKQGHVAIENIREDDLIWDGVEWVSHGGLVNKGLQDTVIVCTDGKTGLHMTPEHKILLKEGWCECGESAGSYWAEVRIPDGYGTGRERQASKNEMAVSMRLRKGESYIGGFTSERKGNFLWLLPIPRFNWSAVPLFASFVTGRERWLWKDTVALSMCMWERGHHSGRRFDEEEVSDKVLRMYGEAVDSRATQDTWNESASRMGSLAFHEAALSRPQSSSVSQLRWSWNQGVQRVAGKFRTLLGRYGNFLQIRVGAGSNRQQCGLLPGELPMGIQKNEFKKQKNQPHHRHPLRKDDRIGSVGINGNRCNNAPVPVGTRMGQPISVYPSECQEQVYDIRNCGPRHRFCVYDRTAGEYRIVSNCTQATARDLLAEAMWRIERAGITIVGHVHDEVILEVPTGSITVEEVCEIMNRNPDWADGIKLNSAGYEGTYYFKD